MIKLFTDSAANLTQLLLKKHKIIEIPFPYTFDGKETEEFNGKEFYDAMRQGKNFNTSMVNIETFKNYFEEELKNGNDIIYIGLSGGVSGTCNAAKIALMELKEKYPDRKTEAIDSLGASLGEGILALEASKRIEKGLSFEETVKEINELIPYMCQCFTVDDLKYLKRTGRVSTASAVVGGLLGIRPLLTGNFEGKIVMFDKIRGAKKALDNLAEIYNEYCADKSKYIGIAHADNDEGESYLISKLKEKGFCGKVLSVIYEPITGSHVGPGTVALFFKGKSRLC